MSKSVNIDGNNYIIVNCESCPFYDDGDGGYGCHCQYPISPSAIVRTDFNSWERIAEDCPLKESGDQNELRPCPFCGNEEVEMLEFTDTAFVLCCIKCYTTGPQGSTEDEAIAKWNGRVGE